MIDGAEDYNIDLIYVDYGDRKEMSLAIVHKTDRAQDQLIGPVAHLNSVSFLARKLHLALPGPFDTPEKAEAFLTLVHMRNCIERSNSVGQSYPFKVGEKND